ncbi:MAG: hypothetical protein ABW096_10105 [Candidatus Thiodiazotropha sp.]
MAASGVIELIGSHPLEPAFRIAYQGNLQIDALGWEAKAKSFYAHAVARSPKTLWLHVQRINLLATVGDPDVQGALIDLFLVLDGRGIALCQRLLTMTKPLLPPEAYDLLSGQLAGDEPSSPPSSRGAVLSAGRLGYEQLIRLEALAAEDLTDPSEVAAELLAYGQADLALEMLERAVLAEPDRLDLHQALLEIYHHSRDKKRITRFLQRLAGRPNPARKAWQDLINEVDEDSDTPG